MMARFASGAQGHLYFSRIATGRKMGYAYDVYGADGAVRFDQEDQNALWLYLREGPEAEQGFPQDPDWSGASGLSAVLPRAGPARDIWTRSSSRRTTFCARSRPGRSIWPTFADGLEVSRIVEAAFASHEKRDWVAVADI